ncbi:immunoglobulin-like domain-containing protein [Paenibacillus sp. JDR-2]|uniref:immunoglobulin-like domain-containing protein n=1 Tax=Paenibacillus sp. (strain JDR-2) TaxID=324057 RepID=UPI000166A4CF|nr:immunoglobulin-like domain-containing protein [Paenibacillus sp. JDR-2]ACT00654.1 S-layer domain protein [Paenibacillus sp. JDR-2]
MHHYWKRPISGLLAIVILCTLLLGTALPGRALAEEQGSVVVVKLPPTDDSYVNPYVGWRDARDDNYGSNNILIVGNNNQPMLKFDLSSITDPIKSATLKLYKNNNNTLNYVVYQGQDDNWSENTITWNNSPDFGTAIPDACSVNPCLAPYGTGIAMPINVTSAVQAEVAGDKTLTLSLIPTKADGTIDYTVSPSFDLVSKDNSNAALRPVLEIETLKSVTEAERVANDKAKLVMQFEGLAVTGNITLPTEGEMNSTISWSSDQPSVISANGTVTRPEWYAEADQPVTLTATITYGNVTDTLDVHVTVQRQPTPTDEQRVAKDKELILSQFNNLTVNENVNLPTVGSYGFSTIDWQSNKPEVVSNTGDVHRPASDQQDATVKMTVTLTYGDVSDHVDMNFIAPKMTERLPSKLLTMQGVITEAQALLARYTVGTGAGQVSQAAKDKFESEIENAQLVLSDDTRDLDYGVNRLRDAGTALINSALISNVVVDTAANNLAYSTYRQELTRLVWQARTMLLIEPEMYTKAAKLAVQEQIDHAEAVLDGTYQVPFIRNRAFTAPRPDEDIQFAIDHYARSSHPYGTKYGLKAVMAWYADNHILTGTYNTIKLNPTDDAFVWVTEKTTPHNGNTLIYGEGRSSYLKFDLSSVTASVLKANLRVTNYKWDTNTTQVHYETNDDWQEGTLLYPSTGAPVLGTIINTFVLGGKDTVGAGVVDLTSQVQLELLGDKNLSLSLDNAPGTVWASEIYSNNTSDVSKRPYLEVSLNQIVDAKLQDKVDRVLSDADALVKGAVVGNGTGHFPQSALDAVKESVSQIVEIRNEGHAEAVGAALVRLDNAMRDMRDAQVMRSEVEPNATMYFDESGLQELRDKIAQSPALKAKYEEAKSISDQTSLEQLQKYKVFLADKPDYDQLNTLYKLWSDSPTLTFTPPAGTVSATLQFTLESVDNEAAGLGHAWIDSVKITPSNAGDLEIDNNGFEEGRNIPSDWQPVTVKGSPILSWEDRNHYSNDGTRSVFISNPTAADQGAWLYSHDIPLTAGLGYTLSFAAKIDGKLKNGVKATITYKNASGTTIGSIDLFSNKKATMGPNTNLSIQADALVYAVTGDITYAKKAKERILWNLNDFLQGAEYWQLTDARPDGIDAYGKVQGGRVASIIASAYTFIANAGVFSPEEHADLVAKLNYMNAFLNDGRDRTELDDYTVQIGASNWESDAVIGAAMLAMVLPELNDSKQLIVNANKLLKAQLTYTIGPEGEWPESIRYSYAVLSRLAVYAKALRNETGEDFFAFPKLVKMFEYTLSMQTPPYAYFNNGISTPAFGDDLLLGGNEFSLLGLYYDEVARTNPKLAAQMYQTWVKAGQSLPANGVETILMESFFTPIGFATDTTPMKLQSTDKYKWEGVYLFRNHYGSSNESFMSIMANKTPLGHSHYDQGSFTLYADSTPLVLDPGVESYFATTKAWYTSSSSHSTMQFQKAGNSSYLDTPLISDNQSFSTNDAIDTMSLRIANPNSGSSGKHTRHFAYVKGLEAYVIWDQVKGASAGTIWNLPVVASKLSTIEGNKVESTGPYNMDLETTVLQPENPVITQEWGRAPAIVPAVDGETKLNYIRVPAEANQNHLTVLYPKAKGKAGLDTEKISSAEGIDVYRLQSEDGKGITVAVNNNDSDQVISISAEHTLVELNTGTEYALENGQANVTVQANGLVVLQDKANVTVPDSGGQAGSSVNAGTDLNNIGSDGAVDADTLRNAFKANPNVEVKANDGVVILPGTALADALINPKASIKLTSTYGTYSLPLSLLKLDDMAKQLGTEVGKLSVRINIRKLNDDESKKLNDKVNTVGGTLIADAFDFNVSIESADGKSIPLDSFGSTYVKRSIFLKTAPPQNATVALYASSNNSLNFVPSKMTANSAEFMRPGNSIYTVVEMKRNFADVVGHWAEQDIKLLAGKLIVTGTSQTKFEPDRKITRAEFAALVVRSLGLSESSISETGFKDIQGSEWYAKAVETAVEAGIVNGYNDGSFRPNQTISRQELAVMVVRAIHYAGITTTITAEEQTVWLSKFKDQSEVTWARKDLAEALSLGILNGRSTDRIGASESATRAESAVMLRRLLTKSGFVAE